MSKSKSFSLASILSLTTGHLLCDFSDMHELAEWVAGHPIWTHEFADRRLWCRLQSAIWLQHPDLQQATGENITRENHAQWLASAIEHYGETRVISKGL